MTPESSRYAPVAWLRGDGSRVAIEDLADHEIREALWVYERMPSERLDDQALEDAVAAEAARRVPPAMLEGL